MIPFIVSGYPNLETSTNVIKAISETGSAAIIELGVPFSDPVADGPVNQQAYEIALQNGMNLQKVIDQVKAIRSSNCSVPIVLFSYLNPIYAFGYENFCKQAKDAGVDGLLILDLPVEEAAPYSKVAKNVGIEMVLLVAPNTTQERIVLGLKTLEPSFVYYISRYGVTGAQDSLSQGLKQELEDLRKVVKNTKIAVGFGISTVKHVATVAQIADGVVVGSKLVDALGREGFESFKSAYKSFYNAAVSNNESLPLEGLI